MNSTVKNILIAIVVGIGVGLILGGLLPTFGIVLPGAMNTVGVGVAIAVTYLYLNLNNRKS